MTRALNRLSAVAVRTAAPGKYCDGGGLWLHKRSDGGGQWVLRIVVHGRRRAMGLGSTATVSLKEAREAADQARKVVRAGGDPIRERQKRRREAVRNLHLLKDVAKDAFEARKGDLKDDGEAGQWFGPLELHVLPRLGRMPIADIGQIEIRDALRQIWKSKPQTYKKAIGRLKIVFDHAAALGLDVDVGAVTKARILLGKTGHEVAHIPAMHWRDVPAFYASLNDGSVTHLALRFLILTGLRSAPVRWAREDWINGDILTVPAEIMKARKGKGADFRVPLSDEALKIVSQTQRHARGGYLFPSVRRGVISDMALSVLMKRRGLDSRPHGMRSAVRVWLAETTTAPHEVAETILGHVAGSAVVNAYRRTDFIEQRRVLMQKWSDHVTSKTGQVLQFLTG